MLESPSSFEPAPESPEPTVLHRVEASYIPNGYKTNIDGITIIFGRPEDELEDKWKNNKSYFGAKTFSTPSGNKKRVSSFIQNRSYIDVDITPEGDINNIHDGNTRLYASVKLGIDPREIPVRYVLPNGEKIEGNFSDAIQAAKHIKEP